MKARCRGGGIDLAALLLLGLSAMVSVFTPVSNLLSGLAVLNINSQPPVIENSNSDVWMDSNTILYSYLNSIYDLKIPYLGYSSTSSESKIMLNTSSNELFEDTINTTGWLTSTDTDKVYHPNLPAKKHSQVILTSPVEWTFSNFKITNTTNLPPDLYDISVDKEREGWGETYTFNATVNDKENDNVVVTLYVNSSNGWVEKGKRYCYPGAGCSFPDRMQWVISDFNASFIGSRGFYFTKDDGTTIYNSSIYPITFEKDNLTLTLVSGDDEKVDRASGSTELKIRVYDDDKETYPQGLVGHVSIQKTDNPVLVEVGTCTVDYSGYCSYTLAPDSSYTVGDKMWKISFDDSDYETKTTPIYNVSVSGNITIDLKSPPYHYSTNVGTPITFTVNYTDDLDAPLSLIPKLEVKPSDETTWLEPCSDWVMTSPGVYQCDWNTLGNKEGFYDIKITGEKENYNTVILLQNQWFNLTNGATNGIIQLTPPSATFNNITITRNETIHLEATFINNGETDANELNLTISGYDSSWGIQPSDGKQSCGTVASQQQCKKEFNITTPNGLLPGEYDLKVIANWSNPDGSVSGLQKGFVINVNENALVEINSSPINKEVIDGRTEELGSFTLWSIGNANAFTITYNITEGNLNTSWISFSPKTIFSMPINDKKRVNLTISVPKFQLSGVYKGNFTVWAQGKFQSKKLITVTVPASKTWNITPVGETYPVEPSTSGNITITLTNTGNTPFNMRLLNAQGNAIDSGLANPVPLDEDINPGDEIQYKVNYSIPQTQAPGMYLLNLTFGSYDSGVNPQRYSSELWLNVVDLPPTIENITYAPNHIDRYFEPVIFNVTVHDYIGVNNVLAFIWRDGYNITVPLEYNGSDSTKSGLWRKAFLANTTTNYHVRIYVNDTSGNLVNSTDYSFEVYDKADLDLNYNHTAVRRIVTNQVVPCSIPNSGGCIKKNLSISDTSLAGAYNINITFSLPGGWTSNPLYYSQPYLADGDSFSKTFDFGIPTDFPAGNYNITINLTWMNPDKSYSSVAGKIPVTVSNIISNITADVKRPLWGAQIKIANDVNFTFNLTDLDKNPLTDFNTLYFKIWRSGQQPFEPCTLTEKASGIYSCIWNSLGQQEAYYNLLLFANKTYYTSLNKTYNSLFYLTMSDTSVSLSTNPSSIEITDMTTEEDYIVPIHVMFENTGETTTYGTRLKFFNIPPGWGITDNGNYSCGDITSGNSCSADFNITIPKGTMGTFLLDVNASWYNPDFSKAFRTLNSPGLQISIVNKPILEIDSPLTADVEHGKHNSAGKFILKSIGTAPVDNLNWSLSNPSNPEMLDWITFSPNYIPLIRTGESGNVSVYVNIPYGQAPGEYKARFNVYGTDKSTLMDHSNLTLNVLESREWNTSVSEINASVEQNSNGVLKRVYVLNKGNVNITFSYTITPTDGILYIIGNEIKVEKTKNNSFNVKYMTASDQPAGLYQYTLQIWDVMNPANKLNIPINVRVADLPPRISRVVFDRAHADLNHENVTVTAALNDSILVQSAWLNITTSNGNRIVPMTFVSGDDTTKSGTYTAKFIPDVPGENSVRIFTKDNAGNIGHSDSYAVDVITKTSFELNLSNNNLTFSDVEYNSGSNQEIVLNLTNTGMAGGYNANLSFSAPSYITVTTDDLKHSKFYSVINENTTVSEPLTISVAPNTPTGTYKIIPMFSWYDPNGLIRFASSSITVVVNPNPKLDVSGPEGMQDIPHDASKNFTITLNSLGNAPVRHISFQCHKTSDDMHDMCSNLNIKFSDAQDLQPGLSEEAVMTVTTPAGTPPNVYAGEVIVTADNGISEAIDINLKLGSVYTWYFSPEIINKTVGQDNYGSLSFVDIFNTGNVPLNFNFWLESLPFVDMNTTPVVIEKQDSRTVQVFYNSSTLTPGTYTGKIWINNSDDGMAAEHIDVNFKVINFSIHVNRIDNITNALAGDALDFSATATNASGNLTWPGSVNWTAYIESSSISRECDNVLFANDGQYWRVRCYLPNVPSGKTYNLRIVATYNKYNAVANKIFTNLIHYKDVDAPDIHSITADSKPQNQPVTIYANITDNVQVTGVYTVIYYPNGTNATSYEPMTHLSGNLYSYTFYDTRQLGDYAYYVHAYDEENLTAENASSFEIYKNIVVAFNISSTLGKVIPSKVRLYKEYSFSNEEKPDLALNITNKTKTAVVHERKYDIEVKVLNNTLLFYGAPLNEGRNFTLKVQDIPARDVDFGKNEVLDAMGIIVTNLTYSAATVEFNYSMYKDIKVDRLAIAGCSDWDSEQKICNGDWVAYGAVPDKNKNTISLDVPHFSAWSLIQLAEETSSSSSGTGGGGGGGYAKATLPNVQLSTTKIRKEMYAGEHATDSFTIANTGDAGIKVSFEVKDLDDFITFDENSTYLANGTSKSIVVNFYVPPLTQPGTYHGSIKVSGTSLEIPVTLIVKQQFEKLVEFHILIDNATVEQNRTLSYKINLVNLGEGSEEVKVDIHTDITNITDGILKSKEESVVLKDKLSLLREFSTKGLAVGDYRIKGIILYAGKNATASAVFKVVYPEKRPYLEGPAREWIPQWFIDFLYKIRFIIFFSLFGALLAYGVFKQVQKVTVKHYEFPVPNMKRLPSTSADTIQIGKITELNKPALIRLKDLSMHAICVGATGGGKTVAAQVIVEEALKNGVNVIVLDPTGQWSGFLQRCNDPEMLSHYSEFGMKASEARGFNGNIRAIEGPTDSIDITPFLTKNREGTEGEIQIFSMHKLKNKDIELFVNSMIKQVFDANLEESNRLETLIVFDEVHRVLESFGGSMRGQDQIERGVREFRKWGVGLLLISQVISDFKEQIRANIGTKIQFRSRDKNDLKMIKETFGIEYVRHIVKAAIGRGMFHNPGYNKGMPYFIDIRPLLHHPHKLSNEELDKYEKYNKIVDELRRKIRLMEARGKDVFDMLSILKLLEKNIKRGKFDMVDIYLDELKEKMNR